MDIISIAGLAIVAAILSLFLKNYRPEYGLLVAAGACVLLLLTLLPQFSQLFELISSYAQLSGLAPKLEPVLKALGIAFIAQLASDLCKDCGENSLASKVELAGKCAILLVCVPLLNQLLTLITGLLK